MRLVRFRRACVLGSTAPLWLRRCRSGSGRHALGRRGAGLQPRLQALALRVHGSRRRAGVCGGPRGSGRPLPEKALPQRDAAAAQPGCSSERVPPGLWTFGCRVAKESSLPMVVLHGGVQGAGLRGGRPPPRTRPFAARGQCLQVSFSRMYTRNLARQRAE